MSLDLDIKLRRGAFALSVQFATPATGVTALFGESGAGKSTIGQLVAGLIRPDSGHIRVNGNTLFSSGEGINLRPERRRIGFVFQDARLFPHLSVKDNLQYGLKRSHARPDGAASLVDFDVMVDLLGIGALLQRRPGGLSGGESQRVAIGRALLSAPDILIMDEPLAALDFARRGEISTCEYVSSRIP